MVIAANTTKSARNDHSNATQARTVRIETITDGVQLAALRTSWNRMDQVDTCPLRSWEWNMNWWASYEDAHSQLMTAVLRDTSADTVVAAMPMCIHSRPVFGRVAKFLGSGDVCTDYATLIATADYRDEAIAAVAKWLIDQSETRAFDRLEFESVRADDTVIPALANQLSEAGFAQAREPAMSSWRVRLSSSWDEHLAKLSKSRRWRCRKLQRDYFDTGRSIVRIADNETTFFEGFEILIDLHQRRRAELGQPGCFASQPFTRFLRAAGVDLLDAGMLELQWIELDGHPIAVEFDLLDGESAYYYQSGMDPKAKLHRPGWQSVMSAMMRAMKRGQKYFDFLRGAETYKQSWGAEEVRQVNYTLVPPHLAARTRAAAVNVARRIRRQTRTVSHLLGQVKGNRG